MEKGPNFYAPTVIAGVTHDMLIMREETFGPVLPVASFETDEQAIQLANDSEFGLAASVWTRDRRRGEALARKINAGTVMVNDVLSCFESARFRMQGAVERNRPDAWAIRWKRWFVRNIWISISCRG